MSSSDRRVQLLSLAELEAGPKLPVYPVSHEEYLRAFLTAKRLSEWIQILAGPKQVLVIQDTKEWHEACQEFSDWQREKDVSCKVSDQAPMGTTAERRRDAGT